MAVINELNINNVDYEIEDKSTSVALEVLQEQVINTKLTMVTSLPLSPADGDVVLYTGTDGSGLVKGGIYQYQVSKWVLISNTVSGVQTLVDGTVFVMDIGKIRFVQLYGYDALKPLELESIVGTPKHKISVFGTLKYNGRLYCGYLAYDGAYSIGYFEPGNMPGFISNGTVIFTQFFFERV